MKGTVEPESSQVGNVMDKNALPLDEPPKKAQRKLDVEEPCVEAGSQAGITTEKSLDGFNPAPDDHARCDALTAQFANILNVHCKHYQTMSENAMEAVTLPFRFTNLQTLPTMDVIATVSRIMWEQLRSTFR